VNYDPNNPCPGKARDLILRFLAPAQYRGYAEKRANNQYFFCKTKILGWHSQTQAMEWLPPERDDWVPIFWFLLIIVLEAGER